MKKAVIYGRVSTQDQDYGRQINDLDEWAKKNGYTVVNRFAEKITGVSKAGERKEFQKMLEYIEKHQIKMILVSELSRIGRLGVHTRLEIETLAEKGVNIFFYDKNQFTLNSKGKVEGTTMMMIGLVLDLAKLEIDQTRQRIISSLKNSARNGKIQGSKFKPYGFSGDENKNITVVESELKVVKEIFKKYDSGLSTTSIATHLNATNTPTRYHQFAGEILRGRKAESYSWTPRTIYRILSNRMWIGERHHKGELVHQSEPILDINLFERVQERLKLRSNRPNKMINNTNYLKGIIYCQCGRSMFMNIHIAKRVNSYVCLSKLLSKQKKCEACNHPSVNIDKLLQSSYLTLVDKYISRMKDKGKTNFDDKIANKKIEISNTELLIKKLNKKLDNLYDDYNERLINKSKYISKKEELENDIELQELKIQELKKELKNFQDLKNKPLKESYSFDQFKQEVKNIVEKIVIGSAGNKMDWMKKTKTDVVIKVSITTITGEIITYHLTKFMGKINPAYLDGSFIVDAELEGDYLKLK